MITAAVPTLVVFERQTLPYQKNSVVFVQNCAKSVHFHPISRNGRIQPRHEIATRLKPHNVQFCSNSTVDQGCNPVLDHTLCTSTQNTSYLDHYWISVHFHTEYTVDQGCNCTLDRTLCASTQNACLTKVVIPLSISTDVCAFSHRLHGWPRM